MIVDSVLEAGLAGCIGARLTLEDDGVAVRQNKTRPDQENAGLTERYLTVVEAQATRSTRPVSRLSGAISMCSRR
jgi:hypothetical protein